MGFEKRAKNRIELSYNHGVYLDMWSVVHFINGALLGSILILLNVSLVTALIITFVLAVLYEGLELALKIVEDIENSLVDVVVALVGLGVYFYLFTDFPAVFHAIAIVVLAVISSVMIFYGWQRYLKDRFTKNVRRLDKDEYRQK